MEGARLDRLVTKEDIDVLKRELLFEIRAIAGQRKPGVKRWLKSAEVRKLLGFSPGKLQALRESGLLEYSQIGGNIYYDPDELAQLFENNRTRDGK